MKESVHMENEQAAKDEINYGEAYRPAKEVYVIKKDGSKENFNVQKVINAVAKSAYRALAKFTEKEEGLICQYVIEKVDELDMDEVPIPVMHNIVESALEQVKPVVAKSYRDYRNYKQDFVRMLDMTASPSCTSATRRTPTRTPRWWPPSAALCSTS